MDEDDESSMVDQGNQKRKKARKTKGVDNASDGNNVAAPTNISVAVASKETAAAIKKRKKCQRMPASIFMNVKTVKQDLNQSKETAVFIAVMAR